MESATPFIKLLKQDAIAYLCSIKVGVVTEDLDFGVRQLCIGKFSAQLLT